LKAQSDFRDQEHKLEAQKLLEDATGFVVEFEKAVEQTKLAAKLHFSEKGGFRDGIHFSAVLAALRSRKTEASLTIPALFQEIAGEDGKLTEGRFLAFVPKLNLGDLADAVSEEQIKSVFGRFDLRGGGEIIEADFADALRTRFVVNAAVAITDALTVKVSKTLRKLDAGELLEQLEEPTKEPHLGLVRVKVKAEKDGAEGFVTLCGNQGTEYLAPYASESVSEKSVDVAWKDCLALAKRAHGYINTKLHELKQVHTGPLAETRKALLGLIPRLHTASARRKQLKAQLTDAKTKHAKEVELEKRRREDATARRFP